MANAATPIPKHTTSVGFSTRHLRKDLLDGMRVAATLRSTNLEDILNQALEAGLPVIRGEAAVRWLNGSSPSAGGSHAKHPLAFVKDEEE